MKNALLSVAIASALLAGSASAAQAADDTNAVKNPFSPAYNHPYRHGVVPTLNAHAAMLRWEKAHPMATSGKTLSYGGGTNGVGVNSGESKVYLVFYGTQWGTVSTDSNSNLKFSGDPQGVASAVQQMFKGIGTNGETWSADLTQWCDGSGVSAGATKCPTTGTVNWIPYQQNIFAGAWYDNTQASPSKATSKQLGNEAIAAALHFGNTTAASNRNAYYVILSPHGTDPDNYESPTSGYCAWHDYTGDVGSSSPYGELAFSNQPYNTDAGTSCGVNFVNSGTAGKLDGYTMTLGHEWHEMMSDMEPSGGWSNQSSGTYAGQENSDECAWISAGSAGGAANIAFGTGTFAEQASWSNDTSSCAISHTILTHGGGGGTPPTAGFTDVVSGLKVTFTDTSTDSGGTIKHHAWNFGDSTTGTAANPIHTYAAAGTYTVTETVTDSAGLSGTATASVTVGASGGPTASFSFVTSGLKTTFTDSSTDTTGTIKHHAWTFGDGTTGTAANPVHTYSLAGTYSVTETVTDNNAQSSSQTSSIVVATSAPKN